MFFALGNCVLDAGIATWESKVYYDYVRPVSAVRELGELGLIGEYDPKLDDYVVEAYQGKEKGTQTILAEDFVTYQTPNSDYSPPFAEYTSGHSAFSAAGAEVLQQYTGSDYFGASVAFEPGESRFEPAVTPKDTVTLEWNSFSEAADEAGMSRLYGGIHFTEGDLNGRELGRKVGDLVFDRAQFYINGGDADPNESTTPDELKGIDLTTASIDLYDDRQKDVELRRYSKPELSDRFDIQQSSMVEIEDIDKFLLLGSSIEENLPGESL